MESLAWAELAVGQELPMVEKPPITKVQLVKYAGASGDFNPIHTADEAARAVGLPGIIAHGMLSMGFLGDYAAELVGAAGYVAQVRVRFSGMVRPGDTLTLRGKVLEKDEEKRTARIAIQAEREPEKPLTAGEATLVFSHAGGAPAGTGSHTGSHKGSTPRKRTPRPKATQTAASRTRAPVAGQKRPVL
jgi:acyl dehydratase